jgi:hypothetical protein|tara:strand:+ start:139 stop:849 length:711 start_codon:yes stop_codon:yes gene_type:complete
MAVSVNTVYQRVLAIANKEQRGYITPQEFNLFANQAQMDIFEQYFYDINQFNRAPGNDTEYSNMLDLLNEKIAIFQKYKQDISVSGSSIGTLPSDVYRLGTIMYVGSTYPVEVDEVRHNDLLDLEKSPLTRATLTRPYYIRLTKTTIELYPSSLASSSSIRCNYVDKPVDSSWAYTVVNGQALYNSTTAVDFELHESEETELVLKVLALAGVSIEDPQLYQIASSEEGKKLQQEKI